MPARETYAGHRCRCVVVNGDDLAGDDRCDRMVTNPDSPFCDDCEQAHIHGPAPELFRAAPS